jgi:class 3 adenylate cyclase
MTVLTSLVDEMVLTAAQAAADSDWDVVRSSIDDALLLDPDQADALALRALADRHQPTDTSARRRHMTVMFCDIVGSTPLAERLDPETVNEVLDGYRELCAASVERYGGTIYQYIGDGMLAYFSYPRAHEDDPRRAVLAGLDLQKALTDYAVTVTDRFGVDFSARVGVHTGLVALGSLHVRGRTEGGAISGTTPNTAARIESAAQPGEIYLSDVTAALVEGYIELEPIGPVELKGLARPVVLYRAVGRTAARSRLDVLGPRLSRFVGRESEIASLLQDWEAVVEEWRGVGDVLGASRPPPAVIVGEPGVGKSRLALSVRRRVVSDGGTVLECASEPFINNPLEPFADGIRRASGVSPFDDAVGRLDKLDDYLGVVDCQSLLPLLARLIDASDPDRAPVPELSPLALRAATVDAVRRWVGAHAVLAPTLLLVEDLQWVDDSTAELLTSLLSDLPAGCLILATSRPDSRHDFGGVFRELRLNTLTRTEAAELAAESGPGENLDAELLATIVERADGVPLFIEQLVTLARSKPETSDAADPDADIPSSLRDLFQMQLDALGGVLVVAQVAATIGRDFDVGTLMDVHRRLEVEGEPPIEQDWLEGALVSLSEAGMLIRRRLGGDRLRFRHALLGDAAYQSQLLTERANRHKAIAEVLVGSETGQNQPGLVAMHFQRAGQPADSITQHLLAADKAGAAGEFAEALTQLDLAEGLMVDLDDSLPAELGIRMARGAARSASEGLAALGLEDEFDRCRELCAELETRESHGVQLENVIAGLWGYYVTRGRLDAAQEITEGNTRHPGYSVDPLRRAYVDSQRATESMFCGRWSEARQFFEDTIDGFRDMPTNDSRWVTPHDPYAASLAFLGPVCAVTGDVERGRRMSERSHKRARELRYPRGPYTIAFNLIYETWTSRLVGEYADAVTIAAEATEIGNTYGFMDWQLLGQLNGLLAQAHLGTIDDGPQQMEPILDFWCQLGAGVGIPMFLIEMAELRLDAGESDLCESTLDRAFTIALNGGTRNVFPAADHHRQNQMLAEAHRIRARLLASRDASPSEIRSEFQRAISVAAAQGSLLFELRAQLDMVDYLSPQDRPEDLLESVRSTTEAFDDDSSFLRLDRARRLVAR